jgi:CDP-glucose 4,6-dehydratase
LVTRCWHDSFLNLEDYGGTHGTLLASARAGSVIGGGDWGMERLVPDLMRAAGSNECVTIRNPHATRPWQHVLEPLSGYLFPGQRLIEGRREFAEAWNFGPADDGNATVGQIAAQVEQAWPRVHYEINASTDELHEAGMLKLDCSKARTRLAWRPVWDLDTAVEKAVLWYRDFYESNAVRSLDDLDAYIADAKGHNLPWAAA